MPPPTVNGTKTFSEVYLNTYDSKHIQIKEQNQHVTFEVKTKVLVSQQNINIGIFTAICNLTNLQHWQIAEREVSETSNI
jgi:hypothetical protein